MAAMGCRDRRLATVAHAGGRVAQDWAASLVPSITLAYNGVHTKSSTRHLHPGQLCPGQRRLGHWNPWTFAFFCASQSFASSILDANYNYVTTAMLRLLSEL